MSITILCELPESVILELEALRKRNRIITDFAIVSVEMLTTKSGEPAPRIGIFIPNENRRVFGGFRKKLSSQLIDARVCRPAMIPSEELAWKSIVQILYQFYDKEFVDGILFEECRNATLRGCIDSLESKLPLTTYLRLKDAVGKLGRDRFEEDYAWYFNTNTPDNDYWRGLEAD